ncbi:ABC transporter permease [Bosea sp. F3-2]|uniref:ABC transporter permease n=1 Tax=Bosea sp. F3-2 TaxID=2599640 RepID=UPI0011EBB086|nr:ABC transporter permease [Bosea sp. F3-2]QEL22906.1 ABC transporter permease [Bosea sp. F3-2]
MQSLKSVNWGRLSLNAYAAAVLVFLMIPSLLIIPISLGSEPFIQFPPRSLSLRWYLELISDPAWVESFIFSLKIAVATTVTATIVGTLAALALVRGRLKFASALQVLTLAPLVVPHIVIAVALYLVFAPIGLTGSFLGFLIAHSMLSVPYVVITVTSALQKLDPSLEFAALSCGASRPKAFFLVVLPNIAPGVAAGAIFAFLASFDEATVSFFISGIEGKTITRKLFEDIDYNLTPVIASVSSVILMISVLLMLFVERMRGSKSQD